MPRLSQERLAITIPPSWQRAADLILKRHYRKILLLGEVDRGKSTFCAYLTSILLQRGAHVAYLDADPGQKIFGPPTTLTLADPDPEKPLSELSPKALYFVGDTSPRGNLLPMVVGLHLLAERASDAPFLIVNTCGYVHEAGAVLQSYTVEALRPDVIVALQKGNEIEPLLQAYRHFTILRLLSPLQARSRSWEERRQHRLRAFRHHFRNRRRYAVPLKRLILQRLFDRPLEEAFVRGRVCAVGNPGQEILGLALVERFERRGGLLWLQSAIPLPEVAVLQIGRIAVPELLRPPLRES